MRQCCCCGLRRGVIVISIILLVLSVMGLIAWIVGIVNLTSRSHSSSETSPAAFSGDIVSITTSIVVISFMLYGAIKERKEFLLPYLVTSVVGLVFLSIISVVLTLLVHIFYIILIIVTALFWWAWVAIYSYWKILGEESPQVTMTAASGAHPQVQIQIEQQQPLYPNPNLPPPYPTNQYPQKS